MNKKRLSMIFSTTGFFIYMILIIVDRFIVKINSILYTGLLILSIIVLIVGLVLNSQSIKENKKN